MIYFSFSVYIVFVMHMLISHVIE